MGSKDPVISDVPVDRPVGDNRHIVDVDVTMVSYPAAPDIRDSHAVVAMVELEVVRKREEAPIDCGGGCAEWDIRNEFETIDGGDLCDSDDSEWDDPWNLVYEEHVDRYNFDALDGMELKVFECLRAVNEPTMMVGEVTGRRLIRQADIIDSAETGNLLTGEDDFSGVAGSSIRRTSGMPDGGETTFYYEGDLSDSDCRLVEDRERDTWDDW